MQTQIHKHKPAFRFCVYSEFPYESPSVTHSNLCFYVYHPSQFRASGLWIVRYEIEPHLCLYQFLSYRIKIETSTLYKKQNRPPTILIPVRWKADYPQALRAMIRNGKTRKIKVRVTMIICPSSGSFLKFTWAKRPSGWHGWHISFHLLFSRFLKILYLFKRHLSMLAWWPVWRTFGTRYFLPLNKIVSGRV